jgi:KRAB domain-containing zinc finger protein
VALNDGLPQHVCRPCTNKLYTCNKIKADFIEAYKKLQECFGFTKSPGIQLLHLPAAVSNYQTFNEMTEEQLVSEDKQLVYDVEAHLVSDVEEQLMSKDEEQLVPGGAEQSACGTEEPLVYEVEQLASEVEEQLVYEHEEHLGPVNASEDFCTVKSRTCKLIEVKEVPLNNMSDMPLNVEESAISYIDSAAIIKGNSPEDKSDHAGNISSVCDIKVQKVEVINKKYKYVCGECEEMFTIKGALTKHKRTHFGTEFECDYCKKQCTSATQLNDHRRIHTKELPFMCEICGKCFRTAMILSNHKYVHKPRIYACEVCNKKWSSKFYLTQHKKVHSSETKMICEVCGKMVNTPFSLEIHMRTHTGEKPFQCAVCGRCFITVGRLRNHRLTHADKNFRCDFCGKEYYFKCELLRHQECHHNMKLYRCPVCFTQFANSQKMNRHRKMYCKKPICIVCTETFLSDEMLHEHQIMEHADEEVAVAANYYRRRQHCKCRICSQSMYSKWCLLKHMQCHEDYSYKSLACEKCPKTFSSTNMLHAHRIWHSELRLFRCATCSKSFRTKYTLKWHDLSVHKNEPPFHCPSCDQQFKRLSDLTVHKRKHTGKRPFTCPICMKKFFTKSCVLKHAKKHSQSSANVAWREVVNGVVPVSEAVLPSQDLSYDIGVAEEVVYLNQDLSCDIGVAEEVVI